MTDEAGPNHHRSASGEPAPPASVQSGKILHRVSEIRDSPGDSRRTNREPDKCDELAWFALDALPERMIPYCREALRHIAAERRFSIYGW